MFNLGLLLYFHNMITLGSFTCSYLCMLRPEVDTALLSLSLSTSLRWGLFLNPELIVLGRPAGPVSPPQSSGVHRHTSTLDLYMSSGDLNSRLYSALSTEQLLNWITLPYLHSTSFKNWPLCSKTSGILVSLKKQQRNIIRLCFGFNPRCEDMGTTLQQLAMICFVL